MIKFLSVLLSILTIGSIYLTITSQKLEEVKTSSKSTSSSVRTYHSGSFSSSSSSGWSSGK